MHSIALNPESTQNEMKSFKVQNDNQILEYQKLAEDCGFKMKEDCDKLVNDTMNIIFDTVNNQIYIASSLGSSFEVVSIPIDESLTRI